MSDYNYDAFSSKGYDFDGRTGPGLGEKAPDFLVLEMGSLTCPLFQSRRNHMQKLDVVDKCVSSVVLYVREAHPGADIPQHVSFATKLDCAQRLKKEDGEVRLVLVDDFEGTVHKAYGWMPNTVFIINRNGCVVFRAQRNNPRATQKALNALLNGHQFRAKSFFFPATPTVAIQTLRRAGEGSVLDFLRSFPSLIWNNLVKRNLRLLLNRPQPLSRDTTC